MLLAEMRGLFTNNHIYKPLEQMVAGEWDLTTTLRARESDYVPVLINRLLQRLQSEISKIAATTVFLSKTVPELSALSNELEIGAKEQASRAGHIAAASRDMAATVHEIAKTTREALAFSNEVCELVNLLHQNSRQLGSIVALIGEISTQTKIVSLNACVEAARAGEEGRAFVVVADEMLTLADRTQEATTKVDSILKGIRESIDKVAQAFGQSSTEEETDDGVTLRQLIHRVAKAGEEQEAKVQGVSSDIQSIAQISQRDSASASRVNELGLKVRGCCDDLITSVGVFRFSAHRTARTMVEEACQLPEMICMDRERQEKCMRQLVDRHPFLELLYVTNLDGVQVTQNIAQGDFKAAYGSTGFGKNWSTRPWFIGATEKDGIYISDVYRSVATGNFCFTISAPLRDVDGEIIGVFGVDVNFSYLLSIKGS